MAKCWWCEQDHEPCRPFVEAYNKLGAELAQVRGQITQLRIACVTLRRELNNTLEALHRAE